MYLFILFINSDCETKDLSERQTQSPYQTRPREEKRGKEFLVLDLGGGKPPIIVEGKINTIS